MGRRSDDFRGEYPVEDPIDGDEFAPAPAPRAVPDFEEDMDEDGRINDLDFN